MLGTSRSGCRPDSGKKGLFAGPIAATDTALQLHHLAPIDRGGRPLTRFPLVHHRLVRRSQCGGELPQRRPQRNSDAADAIGIIRGHDGSRRTPDGSLVPSIALPVVHLHELLAGLDGGAWNRLAESDRIERDLQSPSRAATCNVRTWTPRISARVSSESGARRSCAPASARA
jgi:hypothetical protein